MKPDDSIKNRLVSAEADDVLRSGIKLSEDESKMLTEGAEWARAMRRQFKGLGITSKQRLQALRRARARQEQADA